ncbi:MAG: hypothetical protein F4056_09340 [Chloroflexi bacterium]|nr:hypothetical protein [Chloroflexota bacterium]
MTTATLAAPPAFRTDAEESEHGFGSWQSSPESSHVTPESPATSPRSLPMQFLVRLLQFVEWGPGWDGAGAEHVDRATAEVALRTAESMLTAAPEPFVAPAPSGSLLLQWDFADGSSVEVYVDSETDFPSAATLTRDGVVYEVELIGPTTLRSLLEEHAAMATAR